MYHKHARPTPSRSLTRNSHSSPLVASSKHGPLIRLALTLGVETLGLARDNTLGLLERNAKTLHAHSGSLLAVGDIRLVVGTGGFIAGYWGEVLTVAAEAAGVVGLVIDGGVRDIAALKKRQFPVFARGISVKGTVKASAPSVGQPFNFNGALVAQGDWVVADDDGVIIIPKADAARTLAEGEARASKEAQMMQALTEGRSTLELMNLTEWRTRA